MRKPLNLAFSRGRSNDGLFNLVTTAPDSSTGGASEEK